MREKKGKKDSGEKKIKIKVKLLKLFLAIKMSKFALYAAHRSNTNDILENSVVICPGHLDVKRLRNTVPAEISCFYDYSQEFA